MIFTGGEGLRLILLGLLFHSLHAFAAGPTVTGGVGYSNIVLTGAITVFGGTSGPLGSNPDNHLTYNSCAVTPAWPTAAANLCACNETAIWRGQSVTINLTPPQGVTTGVARARAQDGNSDFTFLTSSLNSITFNWDEICNHMTTPS